MLMASLAGALTLAVFYLTPLYLIYKPPARLISWAARRWPDVLWRVDTKERVVALTLDDGPSEYTEDILDIMHANDAKSTFFIIGSHAEHRDQTMQRIVECGHELANHAMHDEASRALPIETLRQQILDTQALLDGAYKAVGAPPSPRRLFRPGHGWLSTPMRASLAQMGYTAVLGDVFPFDPQIPFASVNAAHVLSMVRPGSIIICHDGRAWTPVMLCKILPALKRRGYRVVPVTELRNMNDSVH